MLSWPRSAYPDIRKTVSAYIDPWNDLKTTLAKRKRQLAQEDEICDTSTKSWDKFHNASHSGSAVVVLVKRRLAEAGQLQQPPLTDKTITTTGET